MLDTQIGLWCLGLEVYGIWEMDMGLCVVYRDILDGRARS